MNRQPYDQPPKWWPPAMTPWWVRLSRGYRWRKFQRAQQIEAVEVHGGDHVQQAIGSGAGVMICPNHSVHYDSAALYLAADQLDRRSESDL